MRAAFYTRQGPAHEVICVGEQPTPHAGPGEVRVRVRTSGVNPSDWKTRGGGPGRAIFAPLIIPHSDGAGDIDEVGPGVPDRLGERVWIWNGQWKRAFGTAAEYIVVPSEQASPLPDDISYAQGACLGIPAFTALQAVRLAQLQSGSTVLIAGGAGAVGNYAIQMAKVRGAQVIATVSGDAKAAHARRAGADYTINYRSENLGGRVKALTQGSGVESVIEMDLSGNARLYPEYLRPHSTVVVYGTSVETALPSLWLMLNSVSFRFFLIYELTAAERSATLKELCALLDRGVLKHSVALQLPLEQVAEAHDIVERGAVMGNVVIDIS